MPKAFAVVNLCWPLIVAALAAGAIGCGLGAPPVPSQSMGPGLNIALDVLPGEWEVVGETVIFTFDERGTPIAISNYGDPEDWRTNVQFGTPQRIESPIGALDIVFEPGMPWIDSLTGEATFSASGTGRNIQVLFVPIPGEGYLTFLFEGQYDAATGELSGTITYEVFYGSLLVYSDADQQFTLRKIAADTEAIHDTLFDLP